MGESLRGIKLGTCEDLYYTTYKQLVDHKSFTDDEKNQFLTPAHGYRFRFPFPDEDSRPFGDAEDFNRGVLLHIPREKFSVEGHSKTVMGTMRGPKVTMEVDCPMGETGWEKSRRMNWSDDYVFEIVQQRPMLVSPGKVELWTVIRCPYCKTRTRLPLEFAEIIVNHISEEFKKFNELPDCEKDLVEMQEHNLHMGIANQMLKGYISPLD